MLRSLFNIQIPVLSPYRAESCTSFISVFPWILLICSSLNSYSRSCCRGQRQESHKRQHIAAVSCLRLSVALVSVPHSSTILAVSGRRIIRARLSRLFTRFSAYNVSCRPACYSGISVVTAADRKDDLLAQVIFCYSINGLCPKNSIRIFIGSYIRNILIHRIRTYRTFVNSHIGSKLLSHLRYLNRSISVSPVNYADTLDFRLCSIEHQISVQLIR